jgi:antitoxin YefM
MGRLGSRLVKNMQNIYRLNASELDQGFLDSLKAKFKDQEIEIIVNPADETDYLMASEANRTRLLKAVENIKQNSQLVEVTLEEIE